MKKYKASIKNNTFSILFILVLFLILLFLTPSLWPYVAIMILFLSFGFVLIAKFTYTIIDGNSLIHVNGLSKKIISITDITELVIQPRFIIQKKQYKNLFLFYKNKNGDLKYIEFRLNENYLKDTISQLIYDLKKLNPNIKLDTATQQLIEQAKH